MSAKNATKLIISSLIAGMLVTGCSSVYESPKSNYTQVDSIPGYSFDVPSDLLSLTTAVTSLDSSTDYGTDYYLYKNGNDRYLLFNISSIVVTVQKGTVFDLANTKDDVKAVQSTDVNGVWFTTDGKSISKDKSEGVYKEIIPVEAEVAVSTQTYGNFAGYVASIQSDNEECTLFVGVPGDSVDSISGNKAKVLNHVAKSFAAAAVEEDSSYHVTTRKKPEDKTDEDITDDETNKDKPTDEAQSETGENEKTSDSTDKITEEVIDEDTVNNVTEENEAPEDEINDNKESSQSSDGVVVTKIDPEEDNQTDTQATVSKIEEKDDVVIDIDEPKEAEEKPSENTVVVSKIEDTDDDKSSDDSKPKDSAAEDENKKEKKTIHVESNQQEAVGGESDIYHMLKIGDKGIFTGLNEGEESITEAEVTIEKLYTGDKATKMIKKLLDNPDQLKKYEDPPIGCRWHLIEYSLSVNPKDVFVNINIVGMDGEKLRSKGVEYSKRTYDIYTSMSAGNHKLYCYYAVPNGCNEYALAVGEKFNFMDGTHPAYYMVNKY
mgnify:CR=1 FL=1